MAPTLSPSKLLLQSAMLNSPNTPATKIHNDNLIPFRPLLTAVVLETDYQNIYQLYNIPHHTAYSNISQTQFKNCIIFYFHKHIIIEMVLIVHSYLIFGHYFPVFRLFLVP